MNEQAGCGIDHYGHSCGACGYRQATPGECFRCGESPASVAAAVADREQTERADRWL